jgi:hypothetical protein
VELTEEDFKAQRDPQLDAAIATIKALISGQAIPTSVPTSLPTLVPTPMMIPTP